MTDATPPPADSLARYAQYTHLRIERPGDGVLLITLDDPDRLNATGEHMHKQLSRVFRTVDDDPLTRAVVITGAGRAFSAGGDLEWVEQQIGDYDQTLAVMREASDLVRTMIDCDTPIISAINGVAVGAGLAVALLADISVMNESARLTDGHIRLGVAAGDHAAVIWPLLCGMAKAKYYLMTAEFIDGVEAERIGLVTMALPADDVVPKALAIAASLAAGPATAIQFTKRSLNLWLRDAMPAFEASLAYEMLNFLGPEVVEGRAALREKREPDFRGVRS
ncbi:MAG: enoyl-CoA hydratase/isomerase family protein [Actinomycetota bacterium]